VKISDSKYFLAVTFTPDFRYLVLLCFLINIHKKVEILSSCFYLACHVARFFDKRTIVFIKVRKNTILKVLMVKA
jgi:hypothetical protein